MPGVRCLLASAAVSLMLPAIAFGQSRHAVETSATSGCPPSGDLSFICDADRPEDLARIPGTRWLIASGFSHGSGLKLVDTKRKVLMRWFDARPAQIARDAAHYPDCATPPEPGEFNARGLSLRMANRTRGALHVVNHGGRESVEVFDVRVSRKGEPELVWKGCLMMPRDHVANAVATFRDGTVLVTVLTRPGTTITDFERGLNTGAVYERRPGAASFSMIAGTELPGNNGLETSRDDREFYVIAFGLRAVAVFARGSTEGPDAIIKAPGFMPDNIHFDGTRLIAAGMNADEPACGGTRKIIDGIADTMRCPRGYRVAILDPRKRQFRVIAEGPRSAAFNGVSSAVVIGRELWLGSYQADRIAFRQFNAGPSISD